MSETFKISIDQDGRTHLPPEIRRRFGLEAGGDVDLVVDEAGVHLLTPDADQNGPPRYARWRELSHELVTACEA